MGFQELVSFTIWGCHRPFVTASRRNSINLLAETLTKDSQYTHRVQPMIPLLRGRPKPLQDLRVYAPCLLAVLSRTHRPVPVGNSLQSPQLAAMQLHYEPYPTRLPTSIVKLQGLQPYHGAHRLNFDTQKFSSLSQEKLRPVAAPQHSNVGRRWRILPRLHCVLYAVQNRIFTHKSKGL